MKKAVISLLAGIACTLLAFANNSDAPSCYITINTGKTIGQANPLFFGVNVLFWIDDNAAIANGKIGQHLKDMPCRLMRYPGGEVGDNFHWRTASLDSDKSFPNSAGPAPLTFDEFMDWCRGIGAEPILVVNLESGFIHKNISAAVKEAADWVHYANIEKGYQVKYWEIGNESYLKGTRYPLTAREYADALSRFSKAMKAIDPSIKIGAIGPDKPTTNTYLDQLPAEQQTTFREKLKTNRKTAGGTQMKNGTSPEASWWNTLTETAGTDFDFAIVHKYISPTTYSSFAEHPVNDGESVADLHRYFEQRLGHPVPIALTEWNTNKKTNAGEAGLALMISEKICSYLEGGTDMACFWPLRYTKNPRALLDVKTDTPYLSYYVMQLYSAHIETRLVAHESSDPQIRVLASCNDDHAAFFLTNKSLDPDGMDVSIHLTGVAAKTATAVTLAAATNTATAFKTETTPVQCQKNSLRCHLPPYSVTLIELRINEQ